MQQKVVEAAHEQSTRNRSARVRENAIYHILSFAPFFFSCEHVGEHVVSTCVSMWVCQTGCVIERVEGPVCGVCCKCWCANVCARA
jgi:hypothetical protein